MLWWSLVLACEGTLCEGRAPSDATEVELQLYALGYGEYEDNTSWAQQRRVVEDRGTWDELVAAIGVEPTDGVDFTSQAAFVNPWVDGGCSEPFDYEGWAQDPQLRVRAVPGEDGGCEAYFPMLDVLVAPRDDTTDLAWCEDDAG